MASEATPFQAVDDTVIVEYSFFLLSDFPEESRTWQADFASERTVQAGLGAAYCLSGGTDHYPAVRIEIHKTTPAALSWWECIDEDVVTFRRQEIRLCSATAEFGRQIIALPRAGLWNIRAASAGRQAAHAMGAATFAVGVERWNLQLWPVAAQD